MRTATLHQLHLFQHSFITFSFIEGTYQRLILVLDFDTSDIFFEALFDLDFLGVSADIYF